MSPFFFFERTHFIMASLFTGLRLLLELDEKEIQEFMNDSLDDMETTRQHYSDLFERFRDLDEGEFFPRS